jgi:hypothetical protein
MVLAFYIRADAFNAGEKIISMPSKSSSLSNNSSPKEVLTKMNRLDFLVKGRAIDTGVSLAQLRSSHRYCLYLA